MTLFGHGGELAIVLRMRTTIFSIPTRSMGSVSGLTCKTTFLEDRVLDTLKEMMSLAEQLGVSSFFYGRVKRRLMINCHLSELLTISES